MSTAWETDEDVADFVDRITRLAEDWRYSDEFIGKVVRTRWPKIYATSESEREELERLRSERKLGPQTQRCPNLNCSVQTCGTAFQTCPKCGGLLAPNS